MSCSLLPVNALYKTAAKTTTIIRGKIAAPVQLTIKGSAMLPPFSSEAEYQKPPTTIITADNRNSQHGVSFKAAPPWVNWAALNKFGWGVAWYDWQHRIVPGMRCDG